MHNDRKKMRKCKWDQLCWAFSSLQLLDLPFSKSLTLPTDLLLKSLSDYYSISASIILFIFFSIFLSFDYSQFIFNFVSFFNLNLNFFWRCDLIQKKVLFIRQEYYIKNRTERKTKKKMNRKPTLSGKKVKGKYHGLKNVRNDVNMEPDKKQIPQLFYFLQHNQKKKTKAKRKKQFKENSLKKRHIASCSQFKRIQNDIKKEQQRKIYQSSDQDFFSKASASKAVYPIKTPCKILTQNSKVEQTYLLKGEKRVRQTRQFTKTSESNNSQGKRNRLSCKIIKCSKIPFPLEKKQRKVSDKDEKIRCKKWEKQNEGISEIKMCSSEYFPSESQLLAFDL